MSQTATILNVLSSLLATSLFFGVWKKSFWAGMSMMSFLFFVMGLVSMIAKFALGIFKFQ